MSQPSSSPCLPAPQSEPNVQVGDATSRSSQEERESSMGKSRPLSRKPDFRASGLQSYQALKRQSQEHKAGITPPKSPRLDTEGGKFKKKALSKQEIVEIRDYVRQLQTEDDCSKEEEPFSKEENSSKEGDRARSEVQSAGTEKEEAMRDMQVSKEGNKKSKTQYFQMADIHPPAPLSEAISESDRNLMASLRQKCQSMDESNGMLQKRICWLREEVEMHLERQLTFDRTKQQLEQQLRLSQQQLEKAKSDHAKEKSLLQSQLAEKDSQISRLKALFVDMHQKFEEERQLLLQQAEAANSEREDQKKQLEERVRQLELSVAAFLQQNQQQQKQSSPQEHTRDMAVRLLQENKYLRVQNHTLARSREEVQRLQKELKRVANQRDSLKKKIIEAAKLNRKHRLDESGDSSLFALSELSFR